MTTAGIRCITGALPAKLLPPAQRLGEPRERGEVLVVELESSLPTAPESTELRAIAA